MSPKIPTVSSCCFCINLRTATLILSVLGTISHFYNALVYSAMPNNSPFIHNFAVACSYFTGVICAAGAYGVWKDNIKMIRTFAVYYWVDLVFGFISTIAFSILAFKMEDAICDEFLNSPEAELDPATCHQFYANAALTVVVALGLSLVVRLHYSLAVWSYYRQISLHRNYLSIDREELDKNFDGEYENESFK
ncbi:hypothetical protein K7432_014142 [Basidiobolus ranarum]|uniref:MARVEL domain-containing protein n=1 Tax=Basidiobolus ranarum TaxID=34480 RepID=A0ABR2VPV3_9FUNG